MSLSNEKLTQLLDAGFCPLADELLPLPDGNEYLTEYYESSTGGWFYYTYKKADFERVHPLGGKTNYVLTVWGNV